MKAGKDVQIIQLTSGDIVMGLFQTSEMIEYLKVASKNNGRVAILLETRNGKSSPATKIVIMVDSPRKYAIKINELKVFFERAFDEKYPQRGEFTYCTYGPVDDEFEIAGDFIRMKDSGEEIYIKKVPYYSGLLDR